MDIPWLSMLVILPLLGAIALLFGPRENKNAKYVGLWTSMMTFLFSLAIAMQFDWEQNSFQLEEKLLWISSLQTYYHLGIDGMSLSFILLTTFVFPLAIFSSFNAINHRTRSFIVAMLILESGVLGFFCALDLLVLYIFFEVVLLPMFLIIAIWGGENRSYASFKFFLYTMAGSLCLLLSIALVLWQTSTTDISEISKIDFFWQKWIWLGMFLGFAVKIPMWPVHTWLPDAHVEAPTAGSVILAAILLKMGGYGMIRLLLGIVPDACEHFAPLVIALSTIAIIYGSLAALYQKDIKKLIAYSSVAHMGFVTLGIFSANGIGIQGAVLQMISHGVISAGLFLVVGVIYERFHTREIEFYGGLKTIMPKFSNVFFLLVLGSIAVPGTSGFSGEFLVLKGIFDVNPMFAILPASSMVLGACYMLLVYKRTTLGALNKNILQYEFSDLDKREFGIFIPLLLVMLLLGIYPELLLNLVQGISDAA